jgi:hypothetical protein
MGGFQTPLKSSGICWIELVTVGRSESESFGSTGRMHGWLNISKKASITKRTRLIGIIAEIEDFLEVFEDLRWQIMSLLPI